MDEGWTTDIGFIDPMQLRQSANNKLLVAIVAHANYELKSVSIRASFLQLKSIDMNIFETFKIY